jgi:hypothetical protein
VRLGVPFGYENAEIAEFLLTVAAAVLIRPRNEMPKDRLYAQ